MSTENILLSPAKTTDFDFYYTLKCEPDSIYWSGYTNALIKTNSRFGLPKVFTPG